MREEKKLMLNEVCNRIDDAPYFILTDYTGLNVDKDQDLRGRLRGVSAEFHVVKNTLLCNAIENKKLDEIKESLNGPTAMISGQGEITEVLKMLKVFVKENNVPTLKMGVLNGTFLSTADLEALASLPSRIELLANMVGSIAAPLSGMVGVMQQLLLSLLYALKAIEEKKQ